MPNPTANFTMHTFDDASHHHCRSHLRGSLAHTVAYLHATGDPPGNDRGTDVQIWDLMTYAMVVVLSLLVFAAYDDRATTGSLQQLLGTFLLLLLYGAAVIPLGYAYSFSFSSPSAAQACSFSLPPSP